MSDVIRFQAEVIKVQTLTDLGIRVTLDLQEDAIPVMAMLAECKRQGTVLHFEASSEPFSREGTGDTGTGRKRKVRQGE